MATSYLRRSLRQRPLVSKVLLIALGGGGGLYAYSEATAFLDDADEKKKVVVLGTGWAGTSFLKNLDATQYDVQVLSPRNYFAFTPLLPSVTVGTVEPRSIVEPIRKIIRKKKGTINFWEAECFKIDPKNRKVHCWSNPGSEGEEEEFSVDYDYLVIAVGARSNTFNTPGVTEHCHFLKEVEDAKKIRRSVIQSFETADLPSLSDEEKRKALHFVVVGGGPTGVEFAAELHDFVTQDLARLYPKLKDLVKISLIEASDHILNMFDKRIGSFAENKFHRDGIDVKTGYMVVNVSDETISMKTKKGDVSHIPYGMVVWSTGIGTRSVIMDFMEEIGQTNRRVLSTDEWLRVEGIDNVYALGDCATIQQRKVMVRIVRS